MRKISFTKVGLSPVMEKIVGEILETNGSKIPVQNFRSDLYKMRFSEEDSNKILGHLQEKGYIIRRGKTIIKI